MIPVDLTQPWRWVATFTWPGGYAERLSSRGPCWIEGHKGRQLAFKGGLPAIKWTQDAPFLGLAVGGRSFGLQALPLDVALVQRVGMAAVAVELAIHVDGQRFARRYPVLTAGVGSWVVREDGQGVDVELREGAYEDRGRLLPARAVLRAEDWDHLPEGNVGEVIPLVIGAPGVWRGVGGEHQVPGSPAIVVDEVTGPRLAVNLGATVATQVTIYSPDAPEGSRTALKTISTMTVRGGRVAYVDLDTTVDFGLSSGDPADVAGWTFYCIWTHGGASRSMRGGLLRSAADVLEWALGRTTLPVDHAHLLAARPPLAGLLVDTYVNDPDLSAWEWLKSAILPWLPVTLVSGPQGVAPVVWSLDFDRPRALYTWTEGTSFWRQSALESAGLDQAREVVVSYGQNDVSDEPVRAIGFRARDLDYDHHGHACALAAVGLQPVGSLIEVTLDHTFHGPTARRVALFQLRACWSDWQIIEGIVDPRRGIPEPGDQGLWNDPDLRAIRRRALVQSVSWVGSFMQVALLVEPTGAPA